jgi:hypothetical protein
MRTTNWENSENRRSVTPDEFRRVHFGNGPKPVINGNFLFIKGLGPLTNGSRGDSIGGPTHSSIASVTSYLH